MPVEATIRSVGLSDYETGLIQGHLKALNAKTSRSWTYLGEGTAADIVISKQEITAPKPARVAVLSGDHFQKMGPNRYVIGSPLRIFSLYDLLVDVETTSDDAGAPVPHKTTTRSIIDIIHDRCFSKKHNSPFSLKLPNNHEYVFQPSLDDWQVLTESAQNDVIDELIHCAPDSLNFRPFATPDQQPPKTSASLSVKALLWALCWRSPETMPNNKAQNTEFRITQWPQLGTWHTESAMFRLAALYGRKYATLEDGANFSSVSPAQVNAFIKGCQLCGMGLQERQKHSSQTANTEARPTPVAQKGLLSSLRRKLGLAFGHE